MPKNEAIILRAKKAVPTVDEAPYPANEADQVVIRSVAVSINPIDWIIQPLGGLIFPWLKYPLVLGWDVAGEVVAVGEEVTRFKKGDRIVGLAAAQDKSVNDPAEGAFQRFVVLRQHMATPIPDTLSYEQAAVMPLALSTAACSPFQAGQLGLAKPSGTMRPTGHTILIWGGSTSVGSNAIQLAVAAGYRVVTTASPRNHDYVRQLGASMAFDYRSSGVVRDIVQALRGHTLAGALAIGAGASGPCIEILGRSEGKKVLSVATPPVSFEDVPNGGRGSLPWLIGKVARLVLGNIGLAFHARRRGVRFKFVNGSSLVEDGLGHFIYADYLPGALASGQHRPLPEAIVFGKGLSSIPRALAEQRRGVSAAKIVVSL